jgi:hypothetical protein
VSAIRLDMSWKSQKQQRPTPYLAMERRRLLSKSK